MKHTPKECTAAALQLIEAMQTRCGNRAELLSTCYSTINEVHKGIEPYAALIVNYCGKPSTIWLYDSDEMQKGIDAAIAAGLLPEGFQISNK